MKKEVPSPAAIAEVLGAAHALWPALLAALRAEYGELTSEWKPSKSDFGRMCVVKQKKRSLLYLTPEAGAVRVAIVLGARAAATALASDLPDAIKRLIAEARPYAEGRGIRFTITSAAELPTVMALVAMKTRP